MRTRTMCFNLPIGQWVDLDGKLMKLMRRGRDKERRLVFEDMDGVPTDMTDRELLEMQQGKERRLCLLTAAEASDRLEAADRPRVTLAPNDPGASDETRRRLDYVRGWERAGCPPRTEEGVGAAVDEVFNLRRERKDQPFEFQAPSARQVLRWIHDWVGSGGDIEALVPQTPNRGNTADRLHPKAREILETIVDDRYLVDTRPTGVAVHAHVVNAFNDLNSALPEAERLTVPSIKSVYACIARVDRYTLDCTRIGRRTADHKWRPVMSGQAATRHNEAWEIDHTMVDAIVVDDTTGLPIGRPWITSVIDRATRVIPGVAIGFDPPGIGPVMDCLRTAILPKDELLTGRGFTNGWPCMGAPEMIVPDQGREFKARTFIDACLTLGIDVQYTPVLKAWYKGKIERFFRTLSTDVFHRVPGTTFSNFFTRNKENIPEKVAIVTLGELRHYTLQYIVDVYHARRHRGLGTSPLEAWHESVRLHGMRPLPDPERLTAALSQVAYRKPQRYGIEFEGLLYNSPEVSGYRIRRDVDAALRIAVDPHDLTSISFLDPATNRFVEVPILPGMAERVRGVSLAKHKLARALQRANPDRLAGDDGLTRAYTLIDDAMRARGAATGLANRRDAARYWADLTRAKPPEEAPAFDTVRSARGVADGLFGERPAADQPDEPEGDNQVEPPAPEAEAETETAPDAAPRAKRGRKRRDEPADDGAATETDATENPDGDLTAFAKTLRMTVRKNTEQG